MFSVQDFTCLQYKFPFVNTMWKEEIARSKQLFLFMQYMFSTRKASFLIFQSNLRLSSANSFILE